MYWVHFHPLSSAEECFRMKYFVVTKEQNSLYWRLRSVIFSSLSLSLNPFAQSLPPFSGADENLMEPPAIYFARSRCVSCYAPTFCVHRPVGPGHNTMNITDKERWQNIQFLVTYHLVPSTKEHPFYCYYSFQMLSPAYIWWICMWHLFYTFDT